MHLTLCKQSALRQLRAMGCSGGFARVSRRRVDLIAPDPSPRKRWNRSLLDELELPAPPDPDTPIDVAVSNQRLRLGSRSFASKVYVRKLPNGAFVRIGKDAAISSPELLFVELATAMSLPEHLLFGFELTGGFSLPPDGSGAGSGVTGIEPATSVEKLTGFVMSAHHIGGIGRARKTLKLLSDGAWSPMEAVVATMLALPLEENGYGLGPCVLNERKETPDGLKKAAARGSRVPDILIGDTGVGINYDGSGHLDLDSIVKATQYLDANPASRSADRELSQSVNDVRQKVVDDIRRNRELAAQGLVVLPVVKEDLYQQGGLDNVVLQAVSAIEVLKRKKLPLHREVLASEFAAKERQKLLWSLLPGSKRTLGDSGVDDAFVKM